MLGHAAAYQFSKKCPICKKWLVGGSCKSKCLEKQQAGADLTAAPASSGVPKLSTPATRVASTGGNLRTTSRSPRIHRLKSPRNSPRASRASPRRSSGTGSSKTHTASPLSPRGAASIVSPRRAAGDSDASSDPASALSPRKQAVLSPRATKKTASSSSSSSSSSSRRRGGGGGGLIAKRAAAFLNQGSSSSQGASGSVDYSRAPPPTITLPTEEPSGQESVYAATPDDVVALETATRALELEKQEKAAAAAAAEAAQAEEKARAEERAKKASEAAANEAAAVPAAGAAEPSKKPSESAGPKPIPAGACGVCMEPLGAGSVKVIGGIKNRRKFHAKCFKCGECGYDFMFPADASYGADNRLHCKSCLKKADREAQIKAKVAAVGTNSSGKSASGAPLPAGACPLCKQMTDDQDNMLIDKKPYHESCVRKEKCTKCRVEHKRSDPVKLLNMGKGQLPLCVNCFKKIGRAMAFSGTLFTLNPGVDLNA